MKHPEFERFSPTEGDGHMSPDSDGQWVEHYQAVAAVEAVEKERDEANAYSKQMHDNAAFVDSIRADKSRLEAENEKLRQWLTDIANMPEYDQDDAHRLRHMARAAFSETQPKEEE